jgi:hypothetical protein
MAKARIATLLSDFGTADPYVAEMKGVLIGMAPGVQIIDISHEVRSHDVLAGAFILAQAVPYFPAGTVHVVVVDPGVGTERRILAASLGGHRVVFPDNGIITLLQQRLPLEEIVAVLNVRFLPRQRSRTFHGRDVFAPVAAHVLNGLPLTRLGPRPDTYTLLDLPEPREANGTLVGQVIYVDRFGNLVSNLSEELISRFRIRADHLCVTCGGRDIGPMSGAYAHVAEGSPLVLLNSMGLVEVAVNRGRACDVLGADVGSEIRLFER